MNTVLASTSATIVISLAFLGGDFSDPASGPAPASTPACSSDVVFDGEVDHRDLLAVLEAWNQTATRADVTRDGIVDQADVVAILMNWGACEPLIAGSFGCGIEDGQFVTADGGCKDLATGRVWSDRLGQNTYFDAEDDIEALTQGGFGDWRMPSESELLEWIANGGPGHMSPPYMQDVYSTHRTGNWVYTVKLGTGEITRRWAYSFMLYYAVRDSGGSPPPPPGGCNGNGICDPGEDCESCPGDCPGRTTGSPSKRFCCGNGILEYMEMTVCPLNY
jgi:hypothetical protein